MPPFKLKRGCDHAPWQGAYVPLALKLGEIHYHLCPVTLIQMAEMREAERKASALPVWAVPVFVALHEATLEFYPTPAEDYLIVPGSS